MNKLLLILSSAALLASCGQQHHTAEQKDYKEGEDLYVYDVEAEATEAIEEYYPNMEPPVYIEENREETVHVAENEFQGTQTSPLSTFSIDVDQAGYTNVRRMLRNRQIPHPDAIRIEEMINYFDYGYQAPSSDEPFAIHSEVAKCPWNADHLIARIALKGTEIPTNELPTNNLVFLLDVSGSMSDQTKLPLLKKSVIKMVGQLRPEDRISIVTYAGSSGVVLPPTSCSYKEDIFRALDRLSAGGSTAGAQGIELAYQQAELFFNTKGNNRIILATDGDFNVGVSNRDELIKLIETKRDKGIDLTILGFGMGNYKDATMEAIANNGNGNYFYIDSEKEADHCLVDNLSGTLLTIAKDVKIQVEFNPKYVSSYRLIGYENRAMANSDFTNDAKDAGELGAGHTVTALYEIVPSTVAQESNLKYQTSTLTNRGASSNELLSVALRYKHPKTNKVFESNAVVLQSYESFEMASNSFQLATGIAGFGMLLKESKHKGTLTYHQLEDMLQQLPFNDQTAELAELVELAQALEVLTADTHE